MNASGRKWSAATPHCGGARTLIHSAGKAGQSRNRNGPHRGIPGGFKMTAGLISVYWRRLAFQSNFGHKGAFEYKRFILSELIGSADLRNADLRVMNANS
jgi:hypothetical protein